MLSAYGFPFLLAALVSYILTPYIKTLAFKIGAIDKPDNRKDHQDRPAQRTGGAEERQSHTKHGCGQVYDRTAEVI